MGMIRFYLPLFLCATALVAQGRTGADAFSLFPGYERLDNEADSITEEFNTCEMWDGRAWVPREGRYTYRNHQPKEGTPQASPVQIGRNLANALKAAGGTVLFQGSTEPEGRKEYLGGEYHVYGKVSVKGANVWFLCNVFNGGDNYSIRAIEERAMEQSITASTMAKALDTDGYIALDIHFDTDKATIKPESAAIVEQIVELLRTSPTLKVSIEGHTDNTGNQAKNKLLSSERAKSVLTAVLAKGIPAGRLSAAGWGQEKPVADNRTAEGRARNRRVEIVKK